MAQKVIQPHLAMFALLFAIVCVYSIGCSSPVDQKVKMRERFREFYVQSEVKDYEPVGEDVIDTIQVIGDIRTTLMVAHTFKARSQAGNFRTYVDTFDVTIFKDEVIAIPRGY